MNVYDENTMSLMASPDLSLGYTYPGRRFVAHHEAVEEVSHMAVMPGTEQLNGGAGLRGKIVDTPAQDAWDEYEDCLLYHAYTEEELVAQKADAEPTKDMEKRVAALEENQSELQEALDMILTGVTE